MARHPSRFLLATLLIAVAAAPAAAAPGDRATAVATRQATIDLHRAVLAQKGTIQASVNQVDTPACTNAIKGAPGDQAEELLIEYILPVFIQMEFQPLEPGITAFAARLEQIPMRDPALRSGRAAWRVLAVKLAQLAPPPADFCAQLDAWRQAGYPAASRPKINDPIWEELIRNDERFERLDRKLKRAGVRLHDLGVSERVVDWWTLETLLDEVEPDEPLVEDEG